MTGPSPTGQLSVTRLAQPRPLRDRLADDVRRGLTGPRKSLPPVYFYDDRGSELFEAITRLEEYYPTRTEAALLAEHADTLVGAAAPRELVELGSGSSTKTRLLLAALRRVGGDRYAALEVSEAALSEAGAQVFDHHPWLTVDGYVGDFRLHLHEVPRTGRRLVAFLGSTIGNFRPAERQELLTEIASALEPGDGLLLGMDLVKDAAVLVPAYDDAQGVTAAFNRNMLEVVNRELDGNLPVDDFAHRAVWDPAGEWIEMHLVATRPIRATLRAIGLDLAFATEEHIVTEYSCKFRIGQAKRELAAAGLHPTSVVTDPKDWFALVLATRDQEAPRRRESAP